MFASITGSLFWSFTDKLLVLLWVMLDQIQLDHRTQIVTLESNEFRCDELRLFLVSRVVNMVQHFICGLAELVQDC